MKIREWIKWWRDLQEMKHGTITWDNAKQAGSHTAEKVIRAQAEAGMPADRIAQAQEEHSGWLKSEARTPEGLAFAEAYDTAAQVVTKDLSDMEKGS